MVNNSTEARAVFFTIILVLSFAVLWQMRELYLIWKAGGDYNSPQWKPRGEKYEQAYDHVFSILFLLFMIALSLFYLSCCNLLAL